jgi:hypothetical protein
VSLRSFDSYESVIHLMSYKTLNLDFKPSFVFESVQMNR